MKKVLALFFACLLLISVSVAEEANVEMSPSKLVGTWYAETITSTNDVYRATGDVRFEIGRDKTAQLILNDRQFNYTWSLSSDRKDLTLKTEENTIFNPSGYMTAEGKLVLDGVKDGTTNSFIGELSMDYHFTKENNTTILPAMGVASVEDELYGTYTALYSMEGYNALIIPEGAVSARIDFAEVELTIDGKSQMYVTDFSDGMIRFALTGTNYGPHNALGIDVAFCNLNIMPTSDPAMIAVTVLDDAGNCGATYYLAKTAE
ncbi:MAG: hypothetical protein IKU70_08400 [Clostridia bacterium]|nr:hypothetical protein [Clostridia bacterium]